MDENDRLVGVLAQSDVALGAKEKAVGEMVEEISKTPTPVTEVDNRPIGDGRVGPITRRLQDRYFDLVRGTDSAHPQWLTLV